MNSNFNRPFSPGGGQGSFGSRPFNPSGRPPYNRGGGRRGKPNIPLNEGIRAHTLRVIDEEGTNLGEMNRDDALKRAQEVGLDIYVINEKTEPPIAKIMDYGKYKYELSKKEKGQKKNTGGELKEIKMHYNIGIGDYNTRLKQSKDFLAKGKNVKLNITLRGREMQHSELAKKLAEKYLDDLMLEGHSDSGVPSRMQGRSIILFVHPGPDKVRVKKAKEKKELEDAANDAELQNP